MAVSKLLPPSVPFEIKAYASVFSAREIEKAIFEFIGKESTLVYSALKKDCVNVSTENKSLTFTLPDGVVEYINKQDLLNSIKQHLKLKFFSEFDVNLVGVKENIDEINKRLNDLEDVIKYSYERPNEGRVIKPVGVTHMYGKDVSSLASYISDCITPGFYTIYGEINEVKIIEYEKKIKKQGENPKGKLVTFVLDDGTARINCIFFAPKNNHEIIKYFVDNTYIVSEGFIDYDVKKEDGSLQFRVIRFSGCERTEFEINPVVMIPPQKYRFAKPEKYVTLSQTNLYSERVPLTSDNIVVFSLLTTSQNKFTTGELLEFSAFKLIGGQIVEYMTSLVRPGILPSEEFRGTLGLLKSEIEKSPTFDQVLPDFYKFFNGCTLVSHPIDLNISVIRPYFEKLHIPEPTVIDITSWADINIVKKFAPKSPTRTFITAENYAKILASV
ncbi:MAG: hypothetical protein IKM44_03140 [Clostridia bacterium]|nr:hypothetical protein [Clostridia bacterium]